MKKDPTQAALNNRAQPASPQASTEASRRKSKADSRPSESQLRPHRKVPAKLLRVSTAEPEFARRRLWAQSLVEWPLPGVGQGELPALAAFLSCCRAINMLRGPLRDEFVIGASLEEAAVWGEVLDIALGYQDAPECNLLTGQHTRSSLPVWGPGRWTRHDQWSVIAAVSFPVLSASKRIIDNILPNLGIAEAMFMTQALAAAEALGSVLGDGLAPEPHDGKRAPTEIERLALEKKAAYYRAVEGGE